MMRSVLCCALTGLGLVLALLTALVQNENRRQALELDALKEECSMLEAIQGDRLERILEKDWAPLPVSPRPAPAPRTPAAVAARADT
jgi:hypothetical protein